MVPVRIGVIVAVLVVGHIIWLRSVGSPQHNAYSPLIFLLGGFPYVVVNLIANISTAFWLARRK